MKIRKMVTRNYSFGIAKIINNDVFVIDSL